MKDKVNNNYEIWIEGYSVTGESGTAYLLGIYNAKNFDNAIRKYIEKNLSEVDWNRYGKGRHAIWACELFDNEKDARRSFG